MAKNAVTDWSTSAASNTDVGGIGIQGSSNISSGDNALREIMAQISTQFGKLNAKGDDLASATTVDLSTATGAYVHITGTTTITALGTVTAGRVFKLEFDGILTLTHNGTSLILPGGANITTAAGDTAEFISEGGGNWRCQRYTRADGKSLVRATQWEAIGTTYSGSGAASLAVTDLSAFRMLRITGFIIPATDGADIRLRTSTNNGSSYDSGASDYDFQSGSAIASTAAAAGGSFSAISLSVGGTGNVSASEGNWFDIVITEFNQATYARAIGVLSRVNTDGQVASYFTSQRRAQGTARNAIQFVASSGNISYFLTINGVRG